MDIRKTAGICPMCKKRNHTLAPDSPGDICDDCFNDLLPKASPVLCNTCHRLAAMVERGCSPDGFVFEVGKQYHVQTCSKCDTSVTNMVILEVEEFLKKAGKKTDSILE